MSPKNLLRHKECKSNLSEFDDVQGHPGFDKQGTRFKRLIKDQNDHSDLEEGIRRLILCSGKVSINPFLLFSFWKESPIVKFDKSHVMTDNSSIIGSDICLVLRIRTGILYIHRI